MNKKLIFGLLILALVALPLFAACGEEEVTTTPPTTPPTTPTEEANWWDKFGEPQYGGTLTFAVSGVMGYNWDVDSFVGADNNYYYEALFEPDWTLDRETYSFTGSFVPDQYWGGNLVETWEQTDPTTITVHLRHGVNWQNKAPVNGRELTAYDVQTHYDRALGKAGTDPFPMYMGWTANWESVTATDNYTVVFKFKAASAQNFPSITERIPLNTIEAPEWVAQGDLLNWQNAVGTGPWMLTGVVEGSSISYSRNPDYWGTDPRYPENPVPYAETLTLLIIPDLSARIAALRSGEIDHVGAGSSGGLPWQQAQALAETDPDLVMAKTPFGTTGVSLKADVAPFTDIRVRKAMQMAIDSELISQSIFGGLGEEVPSGLMTRAYKGYAYAYEDWPQELKDEYAYNPEGAKALLAEAAADGVFVANDLGGFDTNVIVANNNDVGLETLQVFKSMFLDIGVDMEIRPYDQVTVENMRRNGETSQMSAEGAGFNWPPTRIVDLFKSTSQDAIIYGVSDPAYDALDAAFWAATDAAGAASAFQALDKYFLEQHWEVETGEYYQFTVWQPYILGYSGELMFWGQGITWSRLWVDQTLKTSMGR